MMLMVYAEVQKAEEDLKTVHTETTAALEKEE